MTFAVNPFTTNGWVVKGQVARSSAYMHKRELVTFPAQPFKTNKWVVKGQVARRSAYMHKFILEGIRVSASAMNGPADSKINEGAI